MTRVLSIMIDIIRKNLLKLPALKLAALTVCLIFMFTGTGIRFPWSPVVSVSAGLLLATTAYVFHRFSVISNFSWFSAVVLMISARMAPDHTPEDSIVIYSETGRETAVTGYVCSDPLKTKKGHRFYFQTDSIYFTRHIGFPVSGKIAVRLGEGVSTIPEYGDGLKLYGMVSRPFGERNPGEFDYEAYLKREGAAATLSIRLNDFVEYTGKRSGNRFYAGYVLPVKHYILRLFRDLHSPEAASILSALILGVRSELPDEIYEAFSMSGTVHVLSLSGLHVGFILALLWGLFSFLRVPFAWRAVMIAGALWYYAAIADFTPSVTRAVIMATVVLAGELIQRRRMIINNLLIAMILILFIDPDALFHIGFQLSFTAVIAIVWLYPKLESYLLIAGILKEGGNALIRKTIALLLVSFAAQIGTLPFTAYYFYCIPLLAVTANIFVVPLAGLVMTLGFITAATAPLSLTLSGYYAAVNERLIALMTAIPQWFTQIPLAYTDFYRMSVPMLVVYFLILAWLALWKFRPIRMAGLYVLLIGVNAAVWYRAFDNEKYLTVTFLDVGQGDCAVVRTPEDRIILIDAGDRNETYDYGESVIAPYLRKQGISRIHYLIMTHPHDDHIGGIAYLARHFDVDTVLHNGLPVRSGIFFEILGEMRAQKTPHRPLREGDAVSTSDGVHMFVLSPGADYLEGKPYDNINNGSLVIAMRYGRHQILWMGDSEQNRFGHFNKYAYFMKSDVIRVSHHGAGNGTSPDLIRMVQPETAVISVGKFNRHNHPSAQVVQAYEMAGSEVLRTDESGAIVLRSDGITLQRIR